MRRSQRVRGPTAARVAASSSATIAMRAIRARVGPSGGHREERVVGGEEEQRPDVAGRQRDQPHPEDAVLADPATAEDEERLDGEAAGQEGSGERRGDERRRDPRRDG